MDICTGLVNKEFEFFYQPIISLVTGKISGAEALIRWRRPDDSIIPPALFIPLAVEKGFITEITQAMYPILINDLASMPNVDSSFFVSLNLTTADLESENLAKNIGTLLSKKGVSPKRLGIEIIESVLMPPSPLVRKAISDFDEQGISIVLNDFSAGNTTLNYLSQLPLSALKLSLDIVQRAPMTMGDFKIFRHLVSMAHQLEINIIAEGIETQEMFDLILSTGCTSAQGYYFSKPLPLSEFIELLKNQSRWVNYPFGTEYLAQIDHLDFRRDVLREALIIYTHSDIATTKQALTRLPLLEVTDSLLGKWYFGIGQESRHISGFERLGKLNQEFHDNARKLLRAAENHDSWDYMELLITEMTKQSSEIMLLLLMIGNHRILEHYKQKQSKL